jgi:periplasmic divalent cation tolerance protein
MFHHLLIYCTCPDEATARGIADALVSEQLAACVNRVAALRSTYVWNGRPADESEVLLMIKTLASSYEAIELRIKALHPYEVPEIIAVPIVQGSGPYLQWVRTRSTAAK